MPLVDEGITSGFVGKYLPGFREAVRFLNGPHGGGWPVPYSAEGWLSLVARQAYQAGRLAGVSQAFGPIDAPRAPETPEEPLETVEEAWERLGLFEAASACPGPVSAVLGSVVVEPLTGDPMAWAVRQARTALGLSLAEAMEFVGGVTE
jgi:hypothetical protein